MQTKQKRGKEKKEYIIIIICLIMEVLVASFLCFTTIKHSLRDGAFRCLIDQIV